MPAEFQPLPSPDQEELTGLARVWADLAAAGWREVVLRYASHGLLLAVIAGAVWLGRMDLALQRELPAEVALDLMTPLAAGAESEAAAATPLPATELDAAAALAAGVSFSAADPAADGQIQRLTDSHTLIPTRGRTAVITYTVQRGDTLFGIAEKYSLKPETVLWGNYFTLKDDPHLLFPGQVLNILPVDGTYHYVTQGNTVEQIAKFYRVAPQDIVDWTPNRLDPNNLTLIPDSFLVIPGGQRESQAWVVPTISRSTRVSSRVNNFGQCPGGYTGAVGDGVFVWPADNHTLSGYDFSGVHRGIDIRARQGEPIYAADSGVVVYAGPNDYGYGNLIVIDHGNGWQSVYAHLSQWNVVCGQSVFRGNLIGLSGNTGRSSGAHLHFELRYNGAFVNPWNMLPPP